MSVIAIFLIVSMLLVLWFDMTSYTIPNWLVGMMLIAYPVAVVMAPVAVDWKMALVGMLGVFVVGYVIFAMKWMGGGDVKLMTVCALWTGLTHLLDFMVYVALLGGVFSVVVLVARKAVLYAPKVAWPRILRPNEPVPYGVAIALGFLIVLCQGHVPLAQFKLHF